MSCYLHRISHESEISYPLFDLGYLSIGWGDASYPDVLNATGDREAFRTALAKYGFTSKNIFYLQTFLGFQPGDTAVVPTYGSMFSVVKVTSTPEAVGMLMSFPKFYNPSNQEFYYSKDKKRFCTDFGGVTREYDIGFLVKFEVIHRDIPRTYADNELTKRMKFRGTTCNTDDLDRSIGKAISAKGPISLHGKIVSNVVDSVLEAIGSAIDDGKFERLIAWYLKRIGADEVFIPSKNESGKSDGADGDVVATFEQLKIRILVQAKHHDIGSETDDWAVQQISSYADQKSIDGYTDIPWVITTAKFSKTALQRAEDDQRNTRLIDGRGFSEMLINAGLSSVDAGLSQTWRS